MQKTETVLGRPGTVGSEVPAKGIPKFCKFTKSGVYSCLDCQKDDHHNRRCFEPDGNYELHKTCRYTDRMVKCILGFGKKTIQIKFSMDAKAIFQKDLPIILNTLSVVVGSADSVPEIDKEMFKTFLGFLDSNRALLFEPDQILALFQNFLQKHCQESCDLNAVSDSFKDQVRLLHDKLEEDRLDVLDSVSLIEVMVTSFGWSPQIVVVLNEINFEGISGH